MPAMSCQPEDTASLRNQMATDNVVVDASVSASDSDYAAAAVGADSLTTQHHTCHMVFARGMPPGPELAQCRPWGPPRAKTQGPCCV